MPVWLKAPNLQTGASRFTLSSFTLSWVVSRWSRVHLFRFAIRCWLFLDNLIISNLAEHIQILGGEDVSYCVFLLFSLSAMTQMIPEIVENPNKTTKWFVQFTLNVSIKTKILQRYYNTKRTSSLLLSFFSLRYHYTASLLCCAETENRRISFISYCYFQNLVIRFLKKAASNLQQPFKVVVPSHKLPLHDRWDTAWTDDYLGKFWRKNDRLFRGNSVSFKWTSWSQRLIRRPVVVKISAHHFI